MGDRPAQAVLPPTDTGLPDDAVSLVARACAADPSRPAILFEDGIELSRQGLVERVERFAGFLRDRVSPGERVAIAVGNRAEFMIAWIAAMARGATVVPLNVTARSHDAAHLLRDSGAVLAIADPERRELIESLVGRCPHLIEVLVLSDPEPDGLAAYGGVADLALDEAPVDPKAITNVYYTSGTTGPPKGCMVDHSYWLRFVDLYRRIYGMDREDRLLTCLNFFYNDPSWHLLTALHSGSTFVAMRRFSVSRFWDVVRRRRVTQLFGIAAIPSLLLTAPPGPGDRDHDVSFAVQVGIPTPDVHRRLVERWGFPWLDLYGLTETGIVTAVPPALADELVGSGSIGPPAPEVELRLAAEDGGVSTQRGEIEVRAPGMMRGYLGRGKETGEAFRDGWFRTGDLARRNGEGLLYFEGRIKDIIRRSGENVAAEEVEAVLCEHPAVAEAAVVPVPDELRGEEIKAYVKLRAGASPDAVPPRELADHCGERLAPHKVPRFIEYRSDELPRTPSMRVAKRALRESDTDPRAGAWDREREET
jgi:crotonobetaine/carnitine-CoA ligase